LTYTVRPLKSEGVQNLSLVLDGQPVEAAGGQSKQLLSPGPGQLSYFAGKASGNDLQPGTTVTGLWSAFRLLNDAQRAEPAGSGYNLEWILQTRITLGKATVAGASGTPVSFFVDLGGANALLSKVGGGLSCVRQVAK
jgi:hypothetical protein